MRVGFIQDFSTHNERDRQVALWEIEDWTEGYGKIEVVYTTNDSDLTDAPPMDLLVVDYGGLHNGYGAPWMDYGRSVRKYAEDHPGTLVAIWTPFTVLCYRATFEQEFSGPDNIVLRYDDGSMFGSREVPDFADTIKAWLA